MHARVSTYQGPANLSDEQLADVTRQQEESVLPKVRAMAGFAGVLSLVDQTTGKAISVTLWESAEAMAASEADANTVRDDSASIASEEVLGVERYTVALVELP